MRLSDLLEKCKHELTTTHELVVTDRPDVPLSPETSWTLDNTELIKEVSDAVIQECQKMIQIRKVQ